MYNNHPNASLRKSQVSRKHRASTGAWRMRDGEVHPVTVRKLQPATVR